MDIALDLTTAHNHVHAKLRELITAGAIAPGERLDERELASSLGVSRTPVREAVKRLVSDGLVEHRPYQGNFVKRFTPEQVGGLFDVRRALETLAITEAVSRLTDDALEAIRATLDATCHALEAEDMVGVAEADSRFHRLIAQYSENETLIVLLANLEAQIQLVRTTANRNPLLAERTITERAQILDALIRRDADCAATLMTEHINDVKHTVIDQLESEGAAP